MWRVHEIKSLSFSKDSDTQQGFKKKNGFYSDILATTNSWSQKHYIECVFNVRMPK